MAYQYQYYGAETIGNITKFMNERGILKNDVVRIFQNNSGTYILIYIA